MFKFTFKSMFGRIVNVELGSSPSLYHGKWFISTGITRDSYKAEYCFDTHAEAEAKQKELLLKEKHRLEAKLDKVIKVLAKLEN